MNENYLWDKTGEDAEIEHLENVLQAFRQKESLAPILPKNQVAQVRKTSRKVFRFALAAAACLLITLFSLGIWRQFSNLKDASVSNVNIPKPDVVTPNLKDNFEQPAPIKIVDKKPAPKPKRFFEPVSHVIPTFTYQPAPRIEQKKFVKKRKQVQKDIELTKDEQFAYDQLKLALSITSEKLNIVKEKIDSSQENNSAINKKVITK